MSDANIQLIKKSFEKFGSGDIPGVISMLSEDIKWDHRGPEGVPYNHLYKGHAGVGEFFTLIGETLEPLLYEPHEFFASGDRVVVLGVSRWKVKSTGKEWGSDWANAYTVKDGLITEWRAIFDMSAEAAAFSA